MVEDRFSTEMLEGKLKAGDQVNAVAEDGQIMFHKT
jgi:hypothetical protein